MKNLNKKIIIKMDPFRFRKADTISIICDNRKVKSLRAKFKDFLKTL